MWSSFLSLSILQSCSKSNNFQYKFINSLLSKFLNVCSRASCGDVRKLVEFMKSNLFSNNSMNCIHVQYLFISIRSAVEEIKPSPDQLKISFAFFSFLIDSLNFGAQFVSVKLKLFYGICVSVNDYIRSERKSYNRYCMRSVLPLECLYANLKRTTTDAFWFICEIHKNTQYTCKVTHSYTRMLAHHSLNCQIANLSLCVSFGSCVCGWKPMKYSKTKIRIRMLPLLASLDEYK